MRVLFTTYPEKTHLYTMVPLAWALRAAGHDVRVAVQPMFADTVTAAGLTAVPIGGDRHLWQLIEADPTWLTSGLNGLPIPYDSADWRPSEVTWSYLHEGYRRHVGRWHRASNNPMIGDLVAFARQWQPDLVIWEPTTYAGAIAAEACGAAHGRLQFTIDTYGVTRSNYLRLGAGRPADDRPDPLADWLGGHARRYGFDFSEDLVTGQFTIQLLPPALRLQSDDLRNLPMQYRPYGGPAVVPPWLWEPPPRPRVAFSMGMSMFEHTGSYGIDLQDLVDKLSTLDIEVVATLAPEVAKELTRIPDNLRVVSYVPLEPLLATCSAVIHHGGIGTLATSTLAGLPQLTVSFDSDGPALARRLAAHGSGLALHVVQATGNCVRERVERLLAEPGFGAAAGRLRAEMLAMPSPAEMVTHLEDLASVSRRAPAGSLT